MTVIRPNSVSGINSITAQADEIKVFKSNGTQGGLIIGGANLNATTGISTILALNVTGNVSIAGTLTYQDVTNVDSLGIGTFRTGVNVSGGQLDVGSNIKIGNAGVITATSFSGSGANLTSLPSQVTISNNADNRVITGGSGTNLNGESGLTYNGTRLDVTTGDLQVIGGEGGNAELRIVADQGDDGADYWRFQSAASGNNLNIATYASGAWVDKVSITAEGELLLGSSFSSNINTFKMGIKESANENAAILFLDTDNMRGGICGIAKGTNELLTGTTNVDFVLGSLYSDTHIIYGQSGNQNGAIGMTIAGATGHVIINEGLGVGGQDPGGSTLRVHGSIYASLGGNTSWQKLQLEGSNNTAGDAFSINNWGDAEGDYWMIGVNQTMNGSGNYSKTNSGKRTSFVTIDGRMGRVYLGGASTSGNPTEHFYTNWDGTVYMNSGFGSVAPFYGVRAWVQGNSGTNNGSGGLSSLQRVSTGKYRLNFSTAMPDDNYATGCLANNNYSDTSWHGNTETTRVDVHFYSNGSYQDPSEWSAWVIR